MTHDRLAGAASGDRRRYMAVIFVLAVWLVLRLVFWVGYAGADDQFYARYAWKMHRPPMNHMEYRLPTVLAMRAGMLLAGPTEVGATLAPMAFSLILLAAVAWFVGWPRSLDWRATGSVLLAACIPIEVGFATHPHPAAIVSGLLALGAVCILKGGRGVAIAGAALLAVTFMTYIMTFYFIAIFCLTAFCIDRRRYWLPVAACVVMSGALMATEMAVYAQLQGDALARFRTFATQLGDTGIPYGARSGGSKLHFFLHPLQILVFGKHFGFDLLVLAVCGLLAFKHLDRPQRIVLISTLGFWAWLGYGTNVPWAYRPPSRGMHYYTPLIFGVCAVMPAALSAALGNRQRLAKALFAGLILIHLACLSVSGKWGQRVDVSRELLAYANAHPEKRFLTDVHTLNEMYVLNRFELPANVYVLRSESVAHDLLVNKEPGDDKFQFDQRPPPDALLVNHNVEAKEYEPEFQEYLKQRQGPSLKRIPPEYVPAIALIAPLVGDAMIEKLGHRAIRHVGGEVFAVR